MSVIDKAMYENLKNRCHYKRPENQFLTYLNIHDRALTNATVRKLMHTIDKEDVEGEVYCEFFSAENFYRNMRDYYSYIGKCYFKEPEPDDPIENIIDELPSTCGWITLIVEDMEVFSGREKEMREMMESFIHFAVKRTNIILIGKGDYKETFAGCDDDFSEGKTAFSVQIKEPDKDYGGIRISGSLNSWITARVDDVCEKMDRLADVICKCTYKGDTKEALKFMYERHGSREDDDNTGKRA